MHFHVSTVTPCQAEGKKQPTHLQLYALQSNENKSQESQ